MRKARLLVSIIILSTVLAIWKLYPVPSTQALARQWSLKIGFRKQLLVDDTIISERRNVTRELGEVTKVNGSKPIFMEDKPFAVLTVLYDEGRFKMWYVRRVDDVPEQERVPGYQEGFRLSYAESNDGLQWTRKADIKWPLPGSFYRTIIDYAQCPSVFIDPHETDPQQKYKAAYGGAMPGAAALAYSADGIRWTPYNNGKGVTYRAPDYTNQLLWDEDAQVYRLFTRTDFGSAGGKSFEKNPEIRGTRCMINPDVKADPTNWTTVQAKDQRATVITKPFLLEGKKLEVNVDAQNGGVIFEALDAVQTGTPIPGFTQSEAQLFKGVDDLRLQPRWKSHADLAVLKGKMVRLKFHLKNARLYAFQVGP